MLCFSQNTYITQHQLPLIKPVIYNFADVCAFFNTPSIFVAFITSPLTFNLPLINSFCAFALPCTNCPKSLSLSTRVTAAFLPSGANPLPTVPVSLRSMYHESVSPEAFLSVKAKMAPPFLMASLRSASEEEREREISSKAAEEGWASRRERVRLWKD
jgi:hypothetical protein